MKLHERVVFALKNSRMKQADLVRCINRGYADKDKISQAAISKIMTGKSQTMKVDTAIRLANCLNVDFNWLSNGVGEMTKEPITSNIDENSETNLPARRRIPVVSWVHAGSADFADEYVDDDECIVQEVFGLRVKDESMEPLFHDGDLIIIDPTAEPRPGDFVIARLIDEGQTTFKKLRVKGMNKEGQTVMELIPLNPDYETYNSEITRFQIIGKVIEHRTYFRRR
ncbi:LexA family transcriptional regulator [Turicimonas muris]|uniref:LexA family transcriptional regulator n=1 Tax=Turicimonas muris TaxID=1796652 RepID=UPI00248CF04B|nr:XRE family transcriptional regulator [Turicimonas muris]